MLRPTSWGCRLRAAPPKLAEWLLPRRGGFLPFNLQFVHHLLHVGNRRRDPLCPCAGRLRGDLTSQCDDAILDGIFYALVKLLTDESRVQVALDALVQV